MITKKMIYLSDKSNCSIRTLELKFLIPNLTSKSSLIPPKSVLTSLSYSFPTLKKGAKVIGEKCLCDKSQIPSDSHATIVYNGQGACELNMCPDGYLDSVIGCFEFNPL